MSELLIIFRKPPIGTSWAREAIDLALVGAAFGQQATLLFMGDGVYQLLSNQQPDQVEQKGTQAMMKALPMYDIDQVFVCEKSLSERGLRANLLDFECQSISQASLQKLLNSHRQVFNF
ncbi:sulfurtransferase complex subunit TusC [Oceanospirillum linum]|uniref:Sulfurtransferase TusC n=1 Tax=Oceanospirillum linum TaxID=966 RepID=A0A1T1HD19_OCELI|nr:sulfurtransferase complex subunit TusC [Oceanospirillum linum]OOV87754.1 sulfurtransferase TusC [Oceanospirillum linum]SEG13336.1 tRNA 2-thiouridine synthesizing protein C [Oleiphilus messinensis]SMP10275.1 tRNA 2-thiouridine synthesizing protein C [Oceanospirillum linum]